MLHYVAPVYVAVGDPFGIGWFGACAGISCVGVCAGIVFCGGIMFGTGKAPLFTRFSGLKRYSNTFFIQSFSFFIVLKTTKRVLDTKQLTEIDCLTFVGSHYSLCLSRKANWWAIQHFREYLILTRKRDGRNIVIQILQLIFKWKKRRISSLFLTWEKRLNSAANVQNCITKRTCNWFEKRTCTTQKKGWEQWTRHTLS